MLANKIFTSLLVVCSCSILSRSEENEFQKWTKNGSEYQNWTKQGEEYKKQTDGEYGYQSNPYANAYNTGYQEAFREDDGMYSIVPLPKIAPIPKNGLSSQQDGFNRGFYEYYQERKEKWSRGE